MPIKITALTSESFTTISNLCETLDPTEIFLSYFDDVEELDESELENPPVNPSPGEFTIIFKNKRSFKKDANKRKYIIPIPTVFKVESFEIVQIYGQREIERVGSYSVLVKGKVDGFDSVTVIFVLLGFNDSNIRINSSDDLSILNTKTSAFPYPYPPIRKLVSRTRYYHANFHYPPSNCPYPHDPCTYVDKMSEPYPFLDSKIYDFLY